MDRPVVKSPEQQNISKKKLRISWDMAFLFDNNYERNLADLFDFLQCTSTRLGRIKNSCQSF